MIQKLLGLLELNVENRNTGVSAREEDDKLYGKVKETVALDVVSSALKSSQA